MSGRAVGVGQITEKSEAAPHAAESLVAVYRGQHVVQLRPVLVSGEQETEGRQSFARAKPAVGRQLAIGTQQSAGVGGL